MCVFQPNYSIMIWYGMISVDLYSAIVTKVSNALHTLVPRKKPGFQALSKGLIVLLCAEIVWQRVPDHGAVHSECSAADCGKPMSWHHHQLLCGRPETLPADNIGDRCATINKVLRSLAMPTSVHDDTKFCHIEPV